MHRNIWEYFLWDAVVSAPGFDPIESEIKLGVANCTVPRHYRNMYHKSQPTHLIPAMKPTPPTAVDVIACKLADSCGVEDTFENWCDSFGYDTDSRSALSMYLKCQKIRSEMIRVLGNELFEELSLLEH